MLYFDELSRAMKYLAQDDRVVFLGQQVAYPGNALYNSFKDVPIEKRIELPVFENTQLGMSIGLSLMGYIPVSVFPRFDFLVEALPQLVNQLDKIEEFTHGQYQAKVIIRTCVGTRSPLDPGVQHYQDYAQSFEHLLKNVSIIKLERKEQIVPAYLLARDWFHSTILVEMADLYWTE